MRKSNHSSIKNTTVTGPEAEAVEPDDDFGTRQRDNLRDELFRTVPELIAAVRFRIESTRPNKVRYGAFYPIEHKHIQQPLNLVEWFRAQLGLESPVMEGTEADLLLCLAAGIMAREAPPADIKKTASPSSCIPSAAENGGRSFRTFRPRENCWIILRKSAAQIRSADAQGRRPCQRSNPRSNPSSATMIDRQESANCTTSGPRLVQPPGPDAALSEGIARLMLRLEQEGSAELTLAHYRQTAWSLFEFLGCDPPIGQLDCETAARWLDWLRTTFVYRRARGAYPKWFTPSAVSAFLARMPAKQTQERLRRPGPSPSIAAGLLHTSLAWRARRDQAPQAPQIPPPAADRAQDRRHRRPLASHAPSPGRDARAPPPGRVDSGLILLWGVRLKEGLTALLDDMEGHWVLCTGKTGMRIGYLNSQALGIVQALRGQAAWSFAASRHNRVSGWPWGLGKWHQYVRACGIDDGEKPQQDLRKRFSTWVAGKDPQVEMLLAGHGGGVIFEHYLDTMERIPAVMEDFALPTLESWTWPPLVYPQRPPGAATWGPADEAKAAAALCPAPPLRQLRPLA